MTILLPALAFAFGFLVVAGTMYVLAPSHAGAIDRRLGEIAPRADRPEAAPPRFDGAVEMLKRVGEKLPRSPKEMGKLRLRLVNAGFRRDEALYVFFGIRAALALALFGLMATPLLMKPNIAFAFGGLGFGYIVPGFVLGKMAKRRQHRIRLALPDALDLLVVSVEAGLGLDQALQRVGEELAAPYPGLSDEIRLVNLELRAGKGRAEALRNLADRTGVDDLSALVAMLIQTDKFGTSIATSLRVFSDTMRTKRRQRAEEAAAKTGVKMVFPLVFCIFPGIWVVTIGPAAIRFVQVLFPMAQK
jgi:tight adherence protein C